MMFENLPTDKLYKFFAFLGLTCLVTVYIVTEDKIEKHQQAFEKVSEKQYSLMNYMVKEGLIDKASKDVFEMHYSRDSMGVSKIIEKGDKTEIKELLKNTEIRINNIISRRDSLIKAKALFEADVASAQIEVQVLSKKLNYQELQLRKWLSIATVINILGSIFLIYGISAWYSAERIERAAGKIKKAIDVIAQWHFILYFTNIITCNNLS